MSLEHLISPTVPTLTPIDTGERALELMEANNLNQLPMVSADDYLGLVNENDIFEWNKQEAPLSEADFLNFKPIITVTAHPFEALSTIHQMKLSVLPVLDREQKYLGAITKETLLDYLAENSGIENPGAIIVFEMLPNNYSLYEIARICENENVIITNLLLHTNQNGMLEVTIKVNRSFVSDIVATFERYKYNVREIYGVQRNDDDLTDNFNALMNYLSI